MTRLWPDASEMSEVTLANSFKALGLSPSESVVLWEHNGGGGRGVGGSQGVLLNCLDEGGVYAAAAAYRPSGRVMAFSNEPRASTSLEGADAFCAASFRTHSASGRFVIQRACVWMRSTQKCC